MILSLNPQRKGKEKDSFKLDGKINKKNFPKKLGKIKNPPYL